MITERELLVEVIGLLKSNERVKTRYSPIIEKFEQQLAQAKLDRYRLGVIGVTSSGKSTMINAIMKKQLLSMAVRPSSSQLVSCSMSNTNQVKIYFEDKAPVVQIGHNMSAIIQKYSDEKYNPKNSLKVKQLELSTPGFSLPKEVLLVDSPGLDAYGFSGHEKLTMNSLLPTIDFCLFVTTCKTNSDEKMKSVLDAIAEYDCPLIVVQNMIDSIKPSPDGEKSIKQVAEEHKKRIERIINASAIKDKKSVKIVQISAKWALDSYTNKLMTRRQKEEFLEKSNFDSLIEIIEQVFSEVRPRIEHGRILRIRKELQNIVDNAKADLKFSEKERRNIVFQYEGYDKKINLSYVKAQDELSRIICCLEKDKAIYSSRTEDFTEMTINTIKKSVKNAENEIIKTTKKFQNEITNYCNVFSVDARRLRVIDSFGAAPGLKISTKTVVSRKEKRGVVGGIARFFGGIFGHEDWGYEEPKIKEKYDHEQTKENVQKYYESIISLYCYACGNWESSAKSQTDLLIEQYEIQVREFNSRKESLLNEYEMEKIIKQLENTIKKIPQSVKKKKEKNIRVKEPNIEKVSSIKISEETYSFIKISNKVMQQINKKVFFEFTNWSAPQKMIVVGWDKISAELFFQRNFGVNRIDLHQGVNEICDYIKCIVKPDTKSLENICKDRNSYIFIIFNALQYGAALGELDKSGLPKCITSKDKVFFDVQDFEELITGGGGKEGLQNMLSINKDLNTKLSYLIMVNHKNPVYNMVLAEMQRKNCVTHADEIAIIGNIQQRFPYLRSIEIDKVISEIIDSFNRKGK